MPPYQYEDLPSRSPDRFTRLLELLPGPKLQPIRCRLICVSLKESPAYEALSYCWGNNPSSETITIKEAELQVTSNLYDALLRLRDETAVRKLWADAICINQNNIPERNAQVTMMQAIYRRAERTIVWLGRADPETTAVFRKLRELGDAVNIRKEAEVLFEFCGFKFARGDPYATANLGSTDLVAFVHLLQRPWFQRVWIIQEIGVARDVMLLCGEDELSWQGFVAALSYFSNFENDNFHRLDDGLLATPSLADLSRTEFAEGQSKDLFTLLVRHRRSLATDSRDKVFGLYGLAATSNVEQLGVPVDYHRGVRETYTTIAIRMLSAPPGLDILSVPRPLNSSAVPDLPSWVPDWSSVEEIYTLRRQEILTRDLYQDFRASSVSLLEYSLDPTDHPTILTLQGYIIATIEVVSPLETPPERTVSLQTARTAFLSEYARKLDREATMRAGSKEIYRPTSEPVYTAYLRTYLAGHSLEPKNAALEGYLVEEKGAGLRRLAYRLTGKGRYPNLFMLLDFLLPFKRKHPYPDTAQDSREIITQYRRMARTDTDLLALVPGSTVKGDKVMLLRGGKMAYILRDRGNPNGQKWEMLGEAYVHGIMDGEMWDDNRCRPVRLV